MMKTIALLISLLCIPIANANYLGGKVPIYIYGNSNISFGIKNPPLNYVCSYYSRNFTFDATTEAGKNMLSILLAAKMANKKIDIWYQPSSKPGTTHKNGCGGAIAVVWAIGIAEH